VGKKLIAVIIGIIMVGAGAGVYYGLGYQGYINPGISITSFDSTSNSYVNNSTAFAPIPEFYAHVDTSKTAEYELVINGNNIAQGIVTGKQNISMPSSLLEYTLISSALSAPGLHAVTFSILYNSFSTSKSLNIYTFPQEKFSVSHYYIDTGISDMITASNPIDNFAINGHNGGSYTFTPTNAGDYNLSYSMSYKTYHYNGTAVHIHVFNKPKPTGIYYNDYSYCSLSDSSCFNLHMNETGGDICRSYGVYSYSQPLNYSIYVNGTYYATVSNSGYYNSNEGSSYQYERDISYQMSLTGEGPFSIYYIIGDRYYNNTASQTVQVQ
jgi:hypothetical protein